jgi:hypothetical protein
LWEVYYTLLWEVYYTLLWEVYYTLLWEVYYTLSLGSILYTIVGSILYTINGSRYTIGKYEKQHHSTRPSNAQLLRTITSDHSLTRDRQTHGKEESNGAHVREDDLPKKTPRLTRPASPPLLRSGSTTVGGPFFAWPRCIRHWLQHLPLVLCLEGNAVWILAHPVHRADDKLRPLGAKCTSTMALIRGVQTELTPRSTERQRAQRTHHTPPRGSLFLDILLLSRIAAAASRQCAHESRRSRAAAPANSVVAAIAHGVLERVGADEVDERVLVPRATVPHGIRCAQLAHLTRPLCDAGVGAVRVRILLGALRDAQGSQEPYGSSSEFHGGFLFGD